MRKCPLGARDADITDHSTVLDLDSTVFDLDGILPTLGTVSA